MADSTKAEVCLFCRIIKKELPSVIIYEDQSVLAILDAYPATSGHTLVLPKEHIPDIYSMPPKIGASIMESTIKLAKAMKQQLKPAGLNLVQSNEAIAGQVIFHFHLHIIPRYPGDNVVFKFGHGSASTDVNDLQKIAQQIKVGLPK